jgi:septum formation protein
VLASVGVYQVEGLGAHLFDRIDGDHSVILGLPMLKLLAWLRRENLISL